MANYFWPYIWIWSPRLLWAPFDSWLSLIDGDDYDNDNKFAPRRTESHKGAASVTQLGFIFHIYWQNSSTRGARQKCVHRSVQKHRPSAENAILMKEILEKRVKWEDTKSTSCWRSSGSFSLCLGVRMTRRRRGGAKRTWNLCFKEIWEKPATWWWKGEKKKKRTTNGQR